MTVAASLDRLDACLARARPGVREDALLAPAASDCLEMVRAYRTDAAVFAARDDPVNALAALAYACGWLDAALVLGLLDGTETGAGLLRGTVPGRHAARLGEKARRYAAMLGSAALSAGPAPDPASPAHAAALTVVAVARAFHGAAAALLAGGDCEASVQVSSYAHGWLDAGVRSGLLAVGGDRSLFAV
ncbi:MAG: DUF357 domain-containing protein [Methanospirillum sp.]|nr:DUF357 domain-containing protein [Methanospirillum sp.]